MMKSFFRDGWFLPGRGIGLTWEERSIAMACFIGGLLEVIGCSGFAFANYLQHYRWLAASNLFGLLLGVAGLILLWRRCFMWAVALIFGGFSLYEFFVAYLVGNGGEMLFLVLFLVAAYVIRSILLRRLLLGVVCVGYLVLMAHHLDPSFRAQLTGGRILINIGIGLAVFAFFFDLFHRQALVRRKEIEEKNLQLQAAMRLREDFAHIVMHDIGNPLATIMIEADGLIAVDPRPDQAVGLVTIQNNARRLRDMVNDLLLLAKIEHGKLQLNLGAENVAALVDEAVRNMDSLVRRRRLTLRVSHQSDPLLRECDQALLLRVVHNLLSNAIKFSPSRGTVEVRTRSLDSGKIRIEIEDQGPGVPEALRQKIFEKFEIGRLRRDIPQIGLGLAFCRTAVEAHGGVISVSDGANAMGARMTIDF